MREKFMAAGGVMINGTFQSARHGDSWEIGVKGADQIAADMLIGADGSNSSVRGMLFPQLHPEVIWAEQYLLEEKAEPDLISFQYAERYGGAYRWTFPMRDRKKMGFPLGADPRPGNFLERHARGIAVGDLRGIATKDAALIGDAAAQVNPITFGGIRTAVAAGLMAAEAAAGGDLRQYEKAWAGSKFTPARYMPAYLELKDMDEAATAAMARPMAGSMATLRCGAASLTHPKWARAYRAFLQAMKYGW
jgi:flavin-dependent dehydrogenase